MEGFTKVATRDELLPGQMKMAQVEGEQILLANVEGNYYAINNLCSHAEGPLSEGVFEGEEVECPWHGSRFNVTTGQVVRPPAYEAQALYQVRVEGNDILVGPAA